MGITSPMSTWLALPTIAALRGCKIPVAHRSLQAGDYGPVLRAHRRVYAELGAIEKRLGRHLTSAQLAAAGAEKPYRSIVFDTPEESEAAA